ncbi:MAG TPA: RsmE family RNA methyltransferase [Candidatus Dormibacteraeota bacterium]|nr:RsmE family RNA methyltransferase [Candidatus Dormibacteraeota bacterium]
MRRRFLVDSFDAGRACLRGKDARHLGRVLRARPGQLYELSDGQAVWLAKVTAVDRESVDFTLVEPVESASLTVDVTLLLSVIRFAHFEWALEKAAEMGAGAIQPVAASRTDWALLEAAPKRHARWEKIAHEAARQSRRIAPPRVLPLLSPAEVFRQSTAEKKLLLSERPDAPCFERFRPLTPPSSVVLAFGPEGGWTEEEYALALQAGFAEASLGPLILRTETAVVAALAIVLCAWPGA